MVVRAGMRSHNRLYTLLSVLPDADPVVIEAAYKALMKRHHPDIDRQGAAAGERRAAELNHAYQTLRDPGRRAAYDAEESAREERRRAELSRALQPQPARTAPPPPPGPEPVRVGQRLSALIGGAGLLLLGGAIYLFAQGAETQDARPAPASEEAARQFSAADATLFRDQPVHRAEVERAIGVFRRIADVSGLVGAADYSRRCFEGQSRSRDVRAYDHCVAFDHVASRAEAADAADGEPRFQPQSTVPRHIRAAEAIARDPSLIEARLFEIRRLVESELTKLAALNPVVISAAAPQSRPPAPAALRPAPKPARVQAIRPVARRPAPEQDFLERQGGIY